MKFSIQNLFMQHVCIVLYLLLASIVIQVNEAIKKLIIEDLCPYRWSW